MSKRPSFMQRFGRQHMNGSQTLLRSVWNQFHSNLLLIWERSSTKRLVLVRSEFLGQFVNTLNQENLSQQVPMQTSLKVKTCSRFLIAFLKSTLNFEYFERKDQCHSLSISEIINCETGSYLNVQKAIFHATLPQITC